MIDDPAKKAVFDYWEGKPCGTEFGKDADMRKYFQEIEDHRYRVEPFIQSFAQFSSWRGKEVLEVGVGAGTDHVQFARSGAVLSGIDFTKAAVDMTRERLTPEGLMSALQQADAENLPFPDDSFDLVYSWGVIHHTPDTPKAAREIYRVCRPGGKICVMIYHRHSVLALALYVYHGLLRGKPFRTFSDVLANHLESQGTKAYSVREAKEMFGMFRNVEISTVLTPYDKIIRPKFLQTALAPLLDNIPSRYGFFMVIRGEK
jgi:ubiquinone/menaquinone biosynthesis C-methylase UbiE